MALFGSTTPGRSEQFSETVAYRTFVLYLSTRLHSTEAAFANGLLHSQYGLGDFTI